VVVDVVAQHSDCEWDAVVLAGAALALFATITREGVHRLATNAGVVVRDVREKVRYRQRVEVVVEHGATPDPDCGVLMRQSLLQGSRGRRSLPLEFAECCLGSMLDSEVLDEFIERAADHLGTIGTPSRRPAAIYGRTGRRLDRWPAPDQLRVIVDPAGHPFCLYRD
jgi:hypothetical protein